MNIFFHSDFCLWRRPSLQNWFICQQTPFIVICQFCHSSSNFISFFNFLQNVQKVTLGQNPTFYPEITKNLMVEKCEFCGKWDFENVTFVKNETLKLWILSKMKFSNCEFSDKLRIFAPVRNVIEVSFLTFILLVQVSGGFCIKPCEYS